MNDAMAALQQVQHGEVFECRGYRCQFRWRMSRASGRSVLLILCCWAPGHSFSVWRLVCGLRDAAPSAREASMASAMDELGEMAAAVFERVALVQEQRA